MQFSIQIVKAFHRNTNNYYIGDIYFVLGLLHALCFHVRKGKRIVP